MRSRRMLASEGRYGARPASDTRYERTSHPARDARAVGRDGREHRLAVAIDAHSGSTARRAREHPRPRGRGGIQRDHLPRQASIGRGLSVVDRAVGGDVDGDAGNRPRLRSARIRDRASACPRAAAACLDQPVPSRQHRRQRSTRGDASIPRQARPRPRLRLAALARSRRVGRAGPRHPRRHRHRAALRRRRHPRG